MKLFFITAFVFTTLATKAQHKISFSSQNYLGLLEGERGSKFQMQTINGLKYKTWFIGLGTGIDWYFRRSIPTFLSIGKDFLKKGNRNFYVSTSAGINFPWEDGNTYNEWGYNVEKSHSGIYYDAGFGYKIGIGKKNDALLIQLGYSYKHISEEARSYIYYMYPIVSDPQESNFTNRFDYHLRRLSLKIGWNF